MGFRGLSLGSYFVAFTAVLFLSACGQDEAPYQAYGNPGVVPQSGAPNQPGQPGIPGDGPVVDPSTNNPILNPSGVAGPIGNQPPMGTQLPAGNPGGQIQNGPPPGVAVAPAPLPAPVPAPVLAARNYFAKATLFLHGRERSLAWSKPEVDRLMHIVFTMRPGFDIREFNYNYELAIARGWRGYLAYDQAFEWMGMCIATCRL